MWMSSNQLRLNGDKTQFIRPVSSQMLAKTNKMTLRVGGVDVVPSNAVHDLGVDLYLKLTMKSHVDGVVCSCFYQLRQLQSIRWSLTLDAAYILVHVFTQKSRVLQYHPRWLQRLCHSEIAVCSARCCTSGDWCPLEWAHHANCTRLAPLVACTAADHVQDSNDGPQIGLWCTSGTLHWRTKRNDE
jgi:hypothetical protein